MVQHHFVSPAQDLIRIALRILHPHALSPRRQGRSDSMFSQTGSAPSSQAQSHQTCPRPVALSPHRSLHLLLYSHKSGSPKPHLSKPHPCNMTQAKKQKLRCNFQKVALHKLHCNICFSAVRTSATSTRSWYWTIFCVHESGPKNHDNRDRISLLFSLPGNRAIVSTFWGDFLMKLHSKSGETKKNTGENSKNPVETEPRSCRFLSLAVVERVLNEIVWFSRTPPLPRISRASTGSKPTPILQPPPPVGPPLGRLPRGGAGLCRFVPVRSSQTRAWGREFVHVCFWSSGAPRAGIGANLDGFGAL